MQVMSYVYFKDLAVLMLCFNSVYIVVYKLVTTVNLQHMCREMLHLKIHYDDKWLLISLSLSLSFVMKLHIWGWKVMFPGKIVPKLFMYLFIYLCGWLVLTIIQIYIAIFLASCLCLIYVFNCILSEIAVSHHGMSHSQDWECACLMCCRG